jgi:hypothetical protein
LAIGTHDPVEEERLRLRREQHEKLDKERGGAEKEEK